MISESCELVKLCHINCSGPVFLDTLYLHHMIGQGSARLRKNNAKLLACVALIKILSSVESVTILDVKFFTQVLQWKLQF